MPITESDFPAFPTAAGLCDADPHILADLQLAFDRRRPPFSADDTVYRLVFEDYRSPFERTTDQVTECALSNLLLARLDELAAMGFEPANDALVYLGTPTSKVEFNCPFRSADVVCAFGSVINVEDLGALSTTFGVEPGELYEVLAQLAAYGATGTAIGLAQHQLETLTKDHFDLIGLSTGPRFISIYFKSMRVLAN